MTTVIDPTPPPGAPLRQRATGTAAARLLRAELLKVWTTNTWWIIGLIALATTGLALLVNIAQANGELTFAEQNANQPAPFDVDRGEGLPAGEGAPPGEGPPPAEVARMREEWARQTDLGRVAASAAASIYTSGQFFGLLFMVVLGALVVTNEFFHQTATATFLTTPHRTNVIISKLAAAMLLATGFWAVSTAIDLGTGAAFFTLNGYDPSLADWPVVRSVLMNMLAYTIWAVLGVGLGVLIRSQLGATLTAAAIYLLSFPFAYAAFALIRQFIIRQDWVLNWMVAVPGVASTVMISPEPMRFGFGVSGPTWWMGALVLVGYGLVAGVIGTLIIRKRDIS